MAQVQKKFIANDSIDGSKFLLENGGTIRARNAADTSDLDILTVGSSDKTVFLSVPQVLSDAVAGDDLVRLSQVTTLAAYTGGDMITLTAKSFSVDLASTSGLQSTNPGNIAGQLQVKLEASSPTLKIDGSNQLGVKLDAAGAIVTGASGLAVAVDNSTIAISTDQLIVKAGGITNTQVSASAAIAYSKLALSNSIVNADVSTSAAIAYSKLALTGSIVNADINASAAIAYSKLALTGHIVNADVATGAAIAYSKLSLSNSIQATDMNAGASPAGWTLVSTGSGSAAVWQAPSSGITASSEQITLSGTDITNQYVDLAHTATFASVTDNSIILSVVGGPVQLPAVDYEADDGSADSVTRITFLGDLATGGASALVAGDILIVNYDY